MRIAPFLVCSCALAGHALDHRDEAMSKFDFITDERLRTSLEADNNEVDVCFEHGAWKSVHVLVGSIIEALLVDFLMSSGHKTTGGDDILKFDLGKLIDMCKNLGVLTEKTKELSIAVKSYRNLIHPGRLIRLKEKADRNSATVAQALLAMIIEAISQRKTEQYGYTAEQILSKIEKDPSCVSILGHLLRDTKEHEVERLLLRLIPERYFMLQTSEFFDFDEASTIERLAKCFRLAFDAANDEIKARVTQKFVLIVKEAEHQTVFTYEDQFFRASDLCYVSESDRSMIKKHLLSRLADKRTVPLITALDGIEQFILENEVSGLVDCLISEIAYGKSAPLKSSSQEFIVNLWQRTGAPVDKKIESRLQDWKKHFEAKDSSEALNLVERIIEMCDPLPPS